MVIYITESVTSDANNILSEVKTIYEHMLKWKYWTSAQCSSWTNSIFRSIYTISKLKTSTNINNAVNNGLHEYYIHGLDKANGNDAGVSIVDENESVFEEFNNIDLLTDEKSIRNWLLNYSKDDESDDYIDIGYNNYYNKKNSKKKKH